MSFHPAFMDLRPSPPAKAYINALLIQLANRGALNSEFKRQEPLPAIVDEPFKIPSFPRFFRRLKEMTKLDSTLADGSIRRTTSAMLHLADDQMHDFHLIVEMSRDEKSVRIELQKNSSSVLQP